MLSFVQIRMSKSVKKRKQTTVEPKEGGGTDVKHHSLSVSPLPTLPIQTKELYLNRRWRQGRHSVFELPYPDMPARSLEKDQTIRLWIVAPVAVSDVWNFKVKYIPIGATVLIDELGPVSTLAHSRTPSFVSLQIWYPFA